MYAQVLLNHNYTRLSKELTYAIPKGLDLQAGSGVTVPFRNKSVAGIVTQIHQEKPDFKTREIEGQTLDPELLWPWQIELGKWISEHYFCSNFDAYKLMLPKNIWRTPKRKVTRKTKHKEHEAQGFHELSTEQENVVQSILKNDQQSSLIHGVTGAGKTEIYRHLIRAMKEQGKQAILLVPEISLTPQLVKYYEGSCTNFAVLHSQISDGKRAEHWRNIREGKTQLVIGSRSSLFYPFKDLGLIILDEEHERCYKQESSPRYHARNTAQKIAELTGAKVVLGSATPSIESMHKAKSGEYQLFQLHERIHGTELPQVNIVDMREELKARNFSIYSDALQEAIQKTLNNKEQVVLFLNRRGSSSATVCRDCGDALECKNCDVKLTHHNWQRGVQRLICHHCGLVAPMPSSCPSCKSTRIKHFGTGTQKAEEELRKLFPTARIWRADKDSMSHRGSHRKLHDAASAGEIDILIGTQMIAKGLDFPKVSLVGVLMADMGLHIPDFRAAERAFQILTQVAGRAGRRKKRGQVYIQTYSPEHPSIQFAQTHDYHSFYEQEISSRKQHQLPPFQEIIKLTLVHENKAYTHRQAQNLAEKLIKSQDEHQIFSAPSLIPRIKNQYYWNLLIQGPKPRKVLELLTKDELKEWRIDVDPITSV